jgi:hypothetical protein
MIDTAINSKKLAVNENHNGLQFEVLINKKREKVLKIIGFREREPEMGEYSDEIEN